MNKADVLRTYAANRTAIESLMVARDCTMSEAVSVWQSNRHKGRAEIYAEAKSLFEQYRNLGMSKREAKRQVRKDLEHTYRGDGRILLILYWVLKFSLLFIFIL